MILWAYLNTCEPNSPLCNIIAWHSPLPSLFFGVGLLVRSFPAVISLNWITLISLLGSHRRAPTDSPDAPWNWSVAAYLSGESIAKLEQIRGGCCYLVGAYTCDVGVHIWWKNRQNHCFYIFWVLHLHPLLSKQLRPWGEFQ
jgi:hypothetical protein